MKDGIDIDLGAKADWTRKEVKEIYQSPLMALVFKAAMVHSKFHSAGEIQVCSLISIKTGGCTEDCSYCAQSVKYKTEIEVHKILDLSEVLKAAEAAKKNGATRFCMGASWSRIKENKDFDKVLSMIIGIKKMDLEACCSLGMISKEQAFRLKEAGLNAYNHNIDTGENFYEKIISTRTYQDRIDTLKNIMEAGISICSGGILGLGETEDDRIEMIHTLATLPVHPESVPVNTLIPIKGTPLEKLSPPTVWEVIRAIATIRIVLPQSRIRLSAGRGLMSFEQQALCFFSGANSIFAGEKLLTTKNINLEKDKELFEVLGINEITL